MTIRAAAAEILGANPVGRLALEARRRAMDYAMHVTHPELPPELSLFEVHSYGKHLSIHHRRTHSDLSVISQCFAQEQYDVPGDRYKARLQSYYDQLISSGRKPLIVDCGANIGSSVLWFLARFPKAHVLAFEPAPDNFEILQRNCANLDVDLKLAGVSSTNGFACLIDPGNGGWAYQTGAIGSGTEITMLAIAPLLAQKISAGYVPFILKVDIEGGEKSLFAGDSASLDQFPVIIMETHDWLLPGQLSSLPFFQFHANAGREFCMKGENIFSIAPEFGLPSRVAKPIPNPAISLAHQFPIPSPFLNGRP